jgi:hypothetical protein
MRMRKSCIAFSLIILGFQAGSQEDWKAKFPTAEAVYTNTLTEVNIQKQNGNWVAVSDHSEDLVFLTDNSIKMMSRGRIYHSTFNELKKWDAYTRLEGNKKLKVTNTSTTRSSQDYIFYDDSKATSFDFAGVAVNTSRHMEYQLIHTDIHLLIPSYFERYFPVGEAEVRITFPSDIKMKYVLKGDQASKVSFVETKRKGKTTWTFIAKDLVSHTQFPDAPDNSYYATHLIYYVEQVKNNDNWENFLSSPEDLYKHSYEHIRNMNKELSSEIKTLTDSVTKGSNTAEAKARKIYNWVQSNIKYVAFEEGMEGFIPRDASLVCSRRYGDCKDMTSILTAMLNYAGVPAYFTWIGTRDIPYDYSEVPLPISDNHMICAIKSGEGFIFLDGTDNGCIFGFPPSAIQGKEAMISISEKDFKIVRVPVIPVDANTMTDSTFLELTENGIKGRLKINLKGYFAATLYSILSSRNEKDHTDFFKDQYGRASNKIKFSNWKWNISEDHSLATISADLELPDYAKKLQDEWFLNLNLIKWYEHDRMDIEKRKIAVKYSFQSRFNIVTALKIPEGYKLNYQPKSESFKNDAWGFKMLYTNAGNMVYLNQEFITDKLMTMPSQFPDLNTVLEKLTSHYKQTIVLSKK